MPIRRHHLIQLSFFGPEALHIIIINYQTLSPLLTGFSSPQGMYVFMHAVKGTPFETPDQGKARLLTHWEQLDYGVQFTSSRKFFTISPIILYVSKSTESVSTCRFHWCAHNPQDITLWMWIWECQMETCGKLMPVLRKCQKLKATWGWLQNQVSLEFYVKMFNFTAERNMFTGLQHVYCSLYRLFMKE